MKALPPRKLTPPPKRSPAQATHTPIPGHAFGMILYGESGVGKSSLAAEFEDVAFVCDPHEKGIYDLIKFKQCPTPREIFVVDGWKQCLKVHDELILRKDIKTVVDDSLTGMEQLCFRYHCEEYFNDNWTSEGFYSFQQGPKNAAKRDWPDLIAAWEALREAGKNVIVIGHSQIKPFSNPDGNNYDRYSPALDKETWAATHRWATMTVFYKFHTDTTKVGGKHKANEDVVRLLCTRRGSTYDAKNRYGLPPVITAGESNHEAYVKFMEHYSKAELQAE